MSQSLSKDFTIENEQGLHARPAAMFVKLASTFDSEIWVEKEEEQVNGESIMGLMMLAAGPGSTISVTAEGEDGDKALDAIGQLITSGFSD